MTNPFDDPGAAHLVLVNDEGRHGPWPRFAGAREACLAHAGAALWTDPPPRSLAEATDPTHGTETR